MSCGTPSRTSPSNSGRIMVPNTSSLSAIRRRGRRDQPLASRGQAQLLRGAIDQLGLEQLLQPLDLLTDGRLGEVQNPAGRSHATGLGDRHEGTQKGNVDVSSHGSEHNTS